MLIHINSYIYAHMLIGALKACVRCVLEEPADVGKYTVAGMRPTMEAVPPDCPPELIRLMQALTPAKSHFQLLNRLGITSKSP